MKHDANTFYDCHAPQFTQTELVDVLGENRERLNNRIRFGFLNPPKVKCSHGRPERRFSIMDLARIRIINSLVEEAGVTPSVAAQIADYAAPFLNENRFDRDAAGERVSKSRLAIVSRIEDGKVWSRPIYHRENDISLYSDDPDANPDAPRVWIDFTAVITPVSTIFNTRFFLRPQSCWQRSSVAVSISFAGPLMPRLSSPEAPMAAMVARPRRKFWASMPANRSHTIFQRLKGFPK
jgi:hypothetical protein